MQLDFFAKLTARIIAPFRRPEANPPVRPAKENAAALRDRGRMWLHAVGCRGLAARLEVRWNTRMRSTAGTACATRSLVMLNPLIQQFGEEEVERTLKHELAHLVAHHWAGRRRIAPHGPEWRKACLELDLRNEPRCHDLPLPRRPAWRRHRYRCPHCGIEIRRVKPFGRKTACLSCCRAHAHGEYDARFCFVKLAAE